MQRRIMTWFLFSSLSLTAYDWIASWWDAAQPADQGEVRAQEGGNGYPDPPCCP